MNEIAEFIELKGALNSALTEGKFHLLLGIDDQIRSVSTRVISLIRQDVGGHQHAITEMREVIELYRQVIDVCQEESDRAKQEYLKSVSNKQGAANYLNVAGMRYGQ